MTTPYTRNGVRYFAVVAQGGLLADIRRDGRIGLACKLSEVQPMRAEDAAAIAERLVGSVVPYTQEMADARRGCVEAVIAEAAKAIEMARAAGRTIDVAVHRPGCGCDGCVETSAE